MNILSDYAVHAERVLAGDPQVTQRVPGASVAPTLTVYGGELTVDGMTVSAVDHNLNLPASGQTYLMFLKRFGPDAGRYQTVRGALFAVEPNERLSSLLKRADMAIPYKDIVSRSLSEAVIEIARARR